MSIRHLLPIPLVMLALAPMAYAQTPTTPDHSGHPSARAGSRKGHALGEGGLATKKTRYFAPSQEVVVSGVVKPYVRGEVLTLYAIRRGKASKQVRRDGRPPRALRVPLQGREPRPGAARREAQGERRAEGLPHA